MSQNQEKRHEVVFVGLGGQGLLLAGKILSQTGMRYYNHVVWLPVYGAARRGGSCECTVILSNDRIDSPILRQAQTVIGFDPSTVADVEQRVRPDGYFIANRIDFESKRKDTRPILVPATEIAAKIGDTRTVNFVLLGAYLGLTGVVPQESLEETLNIQMKNHRVLSMNLEALKEGIHIGASQKPDHSIWIAPSFGEF